MQAAQGHSILVSMKSFIFLIVAACTVLLSACGNKGPLVLPPQPISTPIPADHVPAPLAPAHNVSESANAETDNEDSDE